MRKASKPAAPRQSPARLSSSKDSIWCPHFECYKYIAVCNRCRIRIKCNRYQDYWAPRFDF